ncbi:MAG: dienelactone hydrolase family protein [Beijerinckiaceae bacterium]
MRQDVIDLYDEFTHRPLPRRVFMERLVALVGSAAAASAALAQLEPNAARAQTVAPDDPRIATTENHRLAEGVVGLLAIPKDNRRQGFVIVVHENRGLNAHIRDVARRMAVEGFAAFAPDYLHAMGGTPADPDAAREMFPKLNPAEVLETSRRAILAAAAHPAGSGKAGMTGFCWGGGQVNRAIVGVPELAAGVAYYGVAPDVSLAPNMKGKLMVHLAGIDDRVNATYPPYETALKAAGKDFVVHRYEGVQHAFNNDTSAERYNKAAADLAWLRTMLFFKKELAAGGARAG